MRAKVARAAVVSALVFAIGAHWMILQSVAWLGMAISYSQDAPLSEALRKTFDGRHPCKLCKVVQEGQNAKKRPDAQKQATKLDLFLVAKQPATFCSLSLPAPPAPLAVIAALRDPPPSPPPKAFLG